MKKEKIKNFIPFGNEWRNSILKNKKIDIVNMFSVIGKEYLRMKGRIDELEEENEQIRDELYNSINGNLGNIKAGKL